MKQFLFAVLFSLALAPTYSAPAIKQPTVQVQDEVTYAVGNLDYIGQVGWLKRWKAAKNVTATYVNGEIVAFHNSYGYQIPVDLSNPTQYRFQVLYWVVE